MTSRCPDQPRGLAGERIALAGVIAAAALLTACSPGDDDPRWESLPANPLPPELLSGWFGGALTREGDRWLGFEVAPTVEPSMTSWDEPPELEGPARPHVLETEEGLGLRFVLLQGRPDPRWAEAAFYADFTSESDVFELPAALDPWSVAAGPDHTALGFTDPGVVWRWPHGDEDGDEDPEELALDAFAQPDGELDTRTVAFLESDLLVALHRPASADGGELAEGAIIVVPGDGAPARAEDVGREPALWGSGFPGGGPLLRRVDGDGRVHLHRLTDEAAAGPLVVAPSRGRVVAAAISPDDEALALVDDGGEAVLYCGDDDDAVELLRRPAEPLTLYVSSAGVVTIGLAADGGSELLFARDASCAEDLRITWQVIVPGRVEIAAASTIDLEGA